MRKLCLAMLTAATLGCHTIPETGPPPADADSSDDVETRDAGDAAQTNVQTDLDTDATLSDMSDPLPASCAEILFTQDQPASGRYTIAGPDGSPIEVDCDMESEGGGWTRVIALDATAEAARCPSDWVLRTEPPRGCGRDELNENVREVLLDVPHPYDEVRGRARGVQFRSTDAFNAGRDEPVDGNYVDGLSIIRDAAGGPEHVWTFAAAISESSRDYANAECPCANGASPPEFVGDDYFCESGSTAAGFPDGWQTSDVLWDESDCTEDEYNWFTRQLPDEELAALRARVLLDSGPGDENLVVTELELWIR